ncbi:MAG: GNAT family N-acetyltransferase [Xanthomonadales bacterium]|nr:GNAT family N-acetyltransferase [Xanthomonadales bacterium]
MPSLPSGQSPLATPVTLRAGQVVLEPLALAHVPALEAAAADGELWQLRYTSVPPPGHMAAYVEAALRAHEAGLMLPFAVRELAHGEVVGCTRYYDLDPALPRLAIGYTWYAQRWQRTSLNSASKLLLLEHAFGPLGCVAVAWHTDILNTRSQQAIARLGATREGVLRAHKRRVDGSIRDTVCFSMLAAEWPAARTALRQRVQRLAAAPAAGV